MKTFEPFLRYCSAIRHRFSLKMTTRCHSVFSLRSPVVLSFHDSDVASLKFATGRPSWVRRISGSAPRLPIRITLLTLPAMTCSVRSRYHQCSVSNLVPDPPAARAIGARWPLSTRLRDATGSQQCSYFVPGPNARPNTKACRLRAHLRIQIPRRVDFVPILENGALLC